MRSSKISSRPDATECGKFADRSISLGLPTWMKSSANDKTDRKLAVVASNTIFVKKGDLFEQRIFSRTHVRCLQ